MSVYAIGDIQGCWRPLKRLLKRIHFKDDCDELWLTGDLVNRGGQSKKVLKWAYKNRKRIVCVLGNHDLAFLAYAEGVHPSDKRNDEFDEILDHDQADDWIKWLRSCPLVHFDPKLATAMVHAGIPAWWSIEKALEASRMVETLLQSDEHEKVLRKMFGNSPSILAEDLDKWDFMRLSINAFTRMRFCHSDGSLNLKEKGDLNSAEPGLFPWFSVPNRVQPECRVVFGHWSALGLYHEDPWYGIDTGAVWGEQLTALNLKDLSDIRQVSGQDEA